MEQAAICRGLAVTDRGSAEHDDHRYRGRRRHPGPVRQLRIRRRRSRPRHRVRGAGCHPPRLPGRTDVHGHGRRRGRHHRQHGPPAGHGCALRPGRPRVRQAVRRTLRRALLQLLERWPPLAARRRRGRLPHRRRERRGDLRAPRVAQPRRDRPRTGRRHPRVRRHGGRRTAATSTAVPATTGWRRRRSIRWTRRRTRCRPATSSFDARKGLATLGGAPYLTWTGIEEYSFFEVGPSHRVTFLGTAAAERVSVGRGVQDIRLGGGDDVLRQGYGALPPGAVRGGPGHDRIGLDVNRGIEVALGGLAVYGAGATRVELAVGGFEDAVVHGRRAVLSGTNADNLLVARTTGRALVTGKGGDDDLRLGVVVRPCRARRVATGVRGLGRRRPAWEPHRRRAHRRPRPRPGFRSSRQGRVHRRGAAGLRARLILARTGWVPPGTMVRAVDITFPPELPVSQRRDDIAAAIRDHQVVVVAGETGSGKTTQLPKICLELGRGPGGRDGIIGHTQPRRIAARSVAERIASELKTELGDEVGYQVRFTDKTSRAGRIKLMTDGILLAELQRDRDLRRYDTIIIDEAHERSLNIDFLLGYLKRLLPRRPDLKLIITSATIDPERFAQHFADRRGRPGADHRGVGPHLPRRHPLPAPRRAARGGRGGRGHRPRPDRGHRRRRGRAGRRGARRHPRVPAGGAGDPRHRRGARGRARAGRDRPPLLPPLGRRATPGVRPAHRPTDRARHQRRRDLADRARHPVRRRQRRRPYLPVLRAHQGPAAAHRGDQPGERSAAVRPLRPRRGGHRDPALLRGGLRVAAGVHRPGDPAHQPGLRHPPDDVAAAGRDRALSLRRAAGQAHHHRRRTAVGRAGSHSRRGSAHEGRAAAGPTPDRPASRPDDPRGREARRRPRRAGDRRGAVAPGPARASRRAAGRRPTSSTPASPTRPPTS